MKVGIIGNYGNDNNGDEAILMGILYQLEHTLKVKREDITVFSNHPDNTRDRYGIHAVPLIYRDHKSFSSINTIFKSYHIMKNLDLLIVGGGGLLMDLYKRDAPLYSVLGMVGRFSKCRVVIYGVGAGPLKTFIGKFFIKRLINLADSVSVRDQQSKKLLETLGINKEIQVIADPAFALPISFNKEPRKEIRYMGVTAVPYFDSDYWPVAEDVKYQQFIRSFALNLDKIIDQKDTQITFYSTKYPQDVKVSREITALMKNKDHVNIIEKNLYPNDIIRLSREQDVIIGTRLHSLILGLVAEVPIIGIGYHHKVKDFMSLINKEELLVEIDDLMPNNYPLVEAFNRLAEHWEHYQEDFLQISMNLKSKANHGVKQLDIHGVLRKREKFEVH